jgi:hypothetical protein
VGEKVTYFAVRLTPGDAKDPVGLARRRQLQDGGIEDQMLRHDLTWQRDGLVAEWKRGDATEELREISGDEAERLVERFRAKWGAGE